MIGKSPSVMQYIFDRIDPMIAESSLGIREAFILGYNIGRQGIQYVDTNTPIYKCLSNYTKKQLIPDEHLTNFYERLFLGEAVKPEELLGFANMKKPPLVEPKKDESIQKLVAKIEAEEEEKRIMDEKKSCWMVNKLHREELEAKAKLDEERKKKVKCDLCHGDVSEDQLYFMDRCAHCFHGDCISEHTNEEFQSQHLPIKCPECSVELSQRDLEEFLEKDELIKYDDLLMENFVKNNPEDYSFCPNPRCTYMFIWRQGDSCDFRCPRCSVRYCLSCRCGYHIGKTCEEYRRQEILKNSEQQFQKFAKGKKLKHCPRCGVWIEKEYGSNILTCICHYTFCFVCLSPAHKCKCGPAVNWPYCSHYGQKKRWKKKKMML